MKNITVFTVLVINFFCTQPVMALDNETYAVTLSPRFGMVYGQAEEIVYPYNTIAPMLSQLLWDINSVFYYGFLLELSRLDPREKWGFFAGFSLRNGIPGSSGFIENRDWQSTIHADLTDYSIHDNHIRELMLLDFAAGVSFPLNRWLFKTSVNVSFIRLSFFGTDGQGEYARQSGSLFHPITDDPDVLLFSGKVISYTQEWLYIAPAFSIGYFFRENFLAELSFIVTPLILCNALDEHKGSYAWDVKNQAEALTRNAQFRDYMQGGIMLEPGLMISYVIDRRFTVFWEISWRYINRTRGIAYSRNPIGFGNYFPALEPSGAGLSGLHNGIGLKVTL